MTDIFFYSLFFLILSHGLFSLFERSVQRDFLQFFGVFLVLFFVALTRSVGFGSDDQAYVDIFNSISSGGGGVESIAKYSYADYNIEFGFFAFLSFLSVFGGAHFLIFGGVGLFSIYLNLDSIRRLTPYFICSCLVYFSHFYIAKELNAIRAGLSSAVLFYAALALYDNKFSKMILAWLLGVSIHVSAAFFAFPLTVYLIKPSRKILAWLAIFIVSFSFVFSAKELAGYFVYLGGIGEKINLYLNADGYSYGISIIDIVNIKNISVIVLSFFLWDKLCSAHKVFYLSFVFFYTAALFRIFFGDFAVLAGRGYSIFSMFEYVLIPFVATALLGRRLGVLAVVLYALFMLFMNLNFNTGWSGGADFFHDWG